MKCLFIGAHPDDLEFGCAGTARSVVEKGGAALFLVMTYGERGGAKDTRKREQEAACEALGVLYGNVGLPDLGIEDTCENCDKLYSAAYAFSPTYIFTHAPRDKHPDHIATTRLAEKVAKILGAPVVYFRSFSSLAFEPDCFIKHDCADAKRTALNCHESQIDKYEKRGIDFVSLAMPNENMESFELWRKTDED